MCAAARRKESLFNGFVVVDKPSAMTSHDVVGRIRRIFSERRVGHAGTLDPDATGVLILGIGRSTRLLRFCAALDKTYVGELVLGARTSTLDASGEVLQRYEMGGIDQEQVQKAAARLLGPIMQVPPMVSAVRVGGEHLYEAARRGEEVERAPRPVKVSSFEVLATKDPLVFGFSVRCSSGTYVRSLCADLGTGLGGGAYLQSLRRTAIGSHILAEAKALEQITVADLRPPLELLSHLAQLVLGPELCAAVATGKVLERRVLGAIGNGPWALSSATGELLALYEPYGDERAKPSVVLAGALSSTAPSGEAAEERA